MAQTTLKHEEESGPSISGNTVISSTSKLKLDTLVPAAATGGEQAQSPPLSEQSKRKADKQRASFDSDLQLKAEAEAMNEVIEIVEAPDSAQHNGQANGSPIRHLVLTNTDHPLLASTPGIDSDASGNISNGPRSATNEQEAIDHAGDTPKQQRPKPIAIFARDHGILLPSDQGFDALAFALDEGFESNTPVATAVAPGSLLIECAQRALEGSASTSLSAGDAPAALTDTATCTATSVTLDEQMFSRFERARTSGALAMHDVREVRAVCEVLEVQAGREAGNARRSIKDMCQRLRHAEKLANEAERRGVAESAGTDAGASSNATAATGTGAGAERGAAVAELDDAAAVRRNLLLGVWASYAHLTRGRKLMFFFRLGLALAQVAVSIVILALPTSLGDSFAADRSGINGGAGGGDPTCDPEPLFAWLFLHMLRVTVALPLDVYLGLSPHRTSRARRPNAQGLEERERARTFGSLLLDRKISKISDLINIVHLVLFIVGNHIVYSNTECSRAPADSVPLFWTSFSMLCITYLIILEILLLVFAIVFFLPCVMFAMRALGLGERLQGKQPPTSKVPQKVADAVKLVYYTPEEVVKETEQATDGAAISAEAADNERPPASSGAEDLSTVSSGAADDREWEKTAPASKRRVGGGLVRLFRVRRHSARHFQRADITRSSSSCSDNNPSRVDASAGMCAAAAAVVPSVSDSRTTRGNSSRKKKTPKLKYPLHALPAHRATCPICLCDFERPEETLAREGMEPEPLRLLDCGHTFHKSCVDEWLTTVSGRCPVCQKPIRKDKVGAGAGAQDGATEA